VNSGLAGEIGELTLEHLTLVLAAMAVAIGVAVPAGILVTRRARWRPWVLGFANVMQTIPSLALFGFLIPVPLIGGIGKRTAIVALVLYALLPILRNTMVGILGVDAAVRESAIAMGLTGRQLLWRVEIPLAARTILAGIRVATVTTIGTATIAAAIGGGAWVCSFFAASRRWIRRRSWPGQCRRPAWRCWRMAGWGGWSGGGARRRLRSQRARAEWARGRQTSRARLRGRSTMLLVSLLVRLAG
jgi:osmoprotectant transport system permease protein